MKTRYLLTLLVVVAFFTLTACVNTEAASPPPESSPLKVGWVIWPGYYPLIIGVEKGFFAEQGLTVEPVLPEGQSTSDLLAGKAGCDAWHNGRSD